MGSDGERKDYVLQTVREHGVKLVPLYLRPYGRLYAY